MKYRLIASDFDNTLYDEVALSPRALKAIAEYRAAGGKFVIATGRIFPAIRPFIDKVGADDEVIACQGSAIYHASSGEVIKKYALDKDTAVAAARFFERNGDVCHAYDDAHFHVAQENPLSKMYGEYCGLKPAVEGLPISEYILEMPVVNKVIGIVSEDTIDAKVEELRALIGKDAEVTKSAPIFLEVTSHDAGKGNALIPESATWCFTTAKENVIDGVSYEFLQEIDGSLYNCIIGTDGADVTDSAHAHHV